MVRTWNDVAQFSPSSRDLSPPLPDQQRPCHCTATRQCTCPRPRTPWSCRQQPGGYRAAPGAPGSQVQHGARSPWPQGDGHPSGQNTSLNSAAQQLGAVKSASDLRQKSQTSTPSVGGCDTPTVRAGASRPGPVEGRWAPECGCGLSPDGLLGRAPLALGRRGPWDAARKLLIQLRRSAVVLNVT